MARMDHILLVEGESDRAFFELICKKLALDAFVRVAAPKDLTGSYNGKEGVFGCLPTELKNLGDGQTTRLGIVLDADSKPNGGFQAAIDRVGKIVAPFGYRLSGSGAGGIIYQNNDGLADLGLWVMPNNALEGMLEDWVKHCMHSDEQTLFTHAISSIDTLPVPKKFNAINRSKAEVATWLAWQKRPGHGLYRIIEDNLIDTRSQLYLELSAWLKHVFSTTPQSK